MQQLKNFFEIQAFGVCSYLGDKLGIPISRIRIFFIYITFVAAGSPILIYLGLAFLLNLRQYVKRKPIWDL